MDKQTRQKNRHWWGRVLPALADAQPEWRAKITADLPDYNTPYHRHRLRRLAERRAVPTPEEAYDLALLFGLDLDGAVHAPTFRHAPASGSALHADPRHRLLDELLLVSGLSPDERARRVRLVQVAFDEHYRQAQDELAAHQQRLLAEFRTRCASALSDYHPGTVAA